MHDEKSTVDVSRALDFVPAESTFSSSSTEFYGGAVSTPSESLGQASYTVLLNDGITDAEVADKGKTLTVKMFSDRNKEPYLLTQGVMGVARTFPVADQIQAVITITPEVQSAEFAS